MDGEELWETLSRAAAECSRSPRRVVPAKRACSHRGARPDALPRPSPPPVVSGREGGDRPMEELWETLSRAAADRSLSPRSVFPAKNACPHALPHPSHPPPPPPRAAAADGRDGRSSGVWGRGEGAVGRGSGGAGDVAAEEAAGRNAVAVAGGLAGNGAEGIDGSLSMVAREEHGIGGRGGGESGGTKRGLESVARPPPKWRAVSAKRQFPPGCGRDAPAPLAGGDGGAAASEKAAASPSPLTDGLLLEAAPARDVLCELDKVAPADGGGSIADGSHHVAVADKCSGGEPEMKQASVRKARFPLPPKWRMVSAKRQFPPGCGRGVMAPPPLAPREDNLVVSQEVVATQRSGSALNQCAMDIVGSVVLNVCVSDGAVEAQELEEGEIPPEESQQDAVCVVRNDCAGGHGSAFPVTAAVTVVSTMRASDEMMLMKRLHCDAAQVAENGLSIGAKCEAAILVVAAKSSVDGPSNEILQSKRVLGSNGVKGELPDVAMGDSDSSSLRSKVPCFGATGIAQVHGKGASNGLKDDQEQEEGEVATEAYQFVQESQVDTNVSPHELTTLRHQGVVPATIAAEHSIGHFSDSKSCKNTSKHEGRSLASEVAQDVMVMNKCKGSSSKLAAEPLVAGPSNEHIGGKSIEKSSMDVAARVFSKVIMRSKTMFTPRKVVKPPVKANHKPPQDTHRSFSKVKQESVAPIRGSFGPRKKFEGKGSAQSKPLHVKVQSTSALVNSENLKDKEASNLEDDDILKALAVHDGNLELYLNLPSCVPSVWRQRHRQHGGQNADARSEIRMVCRRFQFICRALVQAVEQSSLKVRRVDLEADKIIRTLPGFTKPEPIVGNVPGVEVGDEFLYRVELAIVGLHRPYQGGIDAIIHNGVHIAISIVASGGYPDELSSSGELIYTGSGGKPAGKKKDEDQRLERGNLALKNCIKTKTPVRVIHGFKGQNREEGSHSKAKQISTFTYDGLYHVVHFWREGLPGSRVFKYRLQKLPGQPELPLHIAEGLMKSIVRPGLFIADLSEGKEMIPICVINNVDNVRPASFKYMARIQYPSWIAKRRPRHHGCDCIGGCTDSANCACAVKNGGHIPFNFSGIIVREKPLIFECGPSCKCHSSCHNRVSQHGMKIPLEVFRTVNTGWGVRSLRSISSGTFICEYVGDMFHGEEANQRTSSEYLFDIGHNYDDEDRWKGLKSTIPGLNPSGPCFQTMEGVGFTIDAAQNGNIGRFINHSCSPNIYAQNVLWDHDDQRVPHIMFFAAENIPPLQELTYDYGYKIGHIHDLNGRVKVRYCHCGSPQCCGRLY